MKGYMTVGRSMLASAEFGDAAVQSIHAEAKPPAYVIAEVTVKDQEGYTTEFLPARAKAIADSGGRYVVRGGKVITVKGDSPAGRIVVVQFDSLDKAQAFTESAGFRESQII